METRVLIGIVTYDRHRYAFPALQKALAAMQRLSGVKSEVLFADNSRGEEYTKELRAAGFEVLRDSGEGTRIDRIIRGRNTIRQRALQRTYTHLLFIDTDVIPPDDALKRLLSHGKDIVLGVYLSDLQLDGGAELRPVLYGRHPEPGMILPLRAEDIAGDRLIEVMGGGLGCALLSRAALSTLPAFRNIGQSEEGGEDVAFYKDARDAGFTIYADLGVKCFHMRYPLGDPRNDDYRIPSGEMGGDFSF
jgi:hypothetical protein